MVEYHPADEMRCPMHFCVGQESAPAVLSLLVRQTDMMMSHYRSHGYYLAKGGALAAMIAEFYGKASGANGGLAGSMELGSHEQNFCSGAIVGGSMLFPLGTAFAQKYLGSEDISISVMGDGAFDEGITYESMNLAALYELPLLIICENNKYAANTEISNRLGRPELLAKVEAMGIPGQTVDGYDLERLYDILSGAVTATRGRRRPSYVEIMTYRFCAHVGPDPDNHLGYRSVSEIAEWQSRDPLTRLRAHLVAEPATTDQVTRIETSVEQEIATAVDAAKKSPFPALDWALSTNWANSYAPIAEGFFTEIQPGFQGGQDETRLEPF